MYDEDNKKSPVYVGLKLNIRTDADIFDAIGWDSKQRQINIKRLMRIGAAEEQRTEKS